MREDLVNTPGQPRPVNQRRDRSHLGRRPRKALSWLFVRRSAPRRLQHRQFILLASDENYQYSLAKSICCFTKYQLWELRIQENLFLQVRIETPVQQ